jgi:MYXO-CTERM domain-containing protein
MNRVASFVSIAALSASALLILAPPRQAEACGGCFSPPETVTSVDSHRMVVSLSPEKSILWDQIRYTGAPEDFVWVLPVPSPDVDIAVADDLFFFELEGQTAPTISPPPLPPLDCPPPPENDCAFCGGGGGDASGGAADAGGGDVDVYREEVVGPYQTVVIGSDDPVALITWLNDNGYAVPESTRPTIRHYTDQGSLFIVLRLAPDQGVSAMQPVRVEYPGYMGTFPLRMVTVGAYGSLSMTLWIIAEQRFGGLNYPTVEIDPADLVWDFAEGSSNYRALFRRAIDDAGGRAWVAQFAGTLDQLWFQSAEVGVARQAIPYPFLTRLETNMLVDHVAGDLRLGPSDGPYVSSSLQAASYVNDLRTCPDWDGDGDPDTWEDHHRRNDDDLFGCGCRAGTGAGGGSFLALLGVALVLRRRRRRRYQ